MLDTSCFVGFFFFIWLVHLILVAMNCYKYFFMAMRYSTDNFYILWQKLSDKVFVYFIMDIIFQDLIHGDNEK